MRAPSPRLAAVFAALVVAAAACGPAEPRAQSADPYGYTDTIATVAGPPPTQPPDPDGMLLPVDAPNPVGGRSEHGLTGTGSSEPVCVLEVGEGATIDVIADRVIGVDAEELRSENGLRDHANVEKGQLVDICVDNGVWDVYGTARVPPSGPYAKRLQTALNQLFASTSMLELAVDGDAGKLTQQATCAARAVIGLPVSTGYPIPNSPDSKAILKAKPEDMRVPEGAPIEAERWIVIDKTCQVMFAGEYGNLVDVYPTSTGAPGYETTVGAYDGYRFDPALDRGGWHDSTAYPSDVDAPNNGNMYKPLYFNGGEAIHGAAYIPAEPRSKGCARTFPQHQDKILTWLGLDVLGDVTWKTEVIDVAVVVRGQYLTPAGEPLPEPDIIVPPAYEQTDTTVTEDGAATESTTTDGTATGGTAVESDDSPSPSGDPESTEPTGSDVGDTGSTTSPSS